MIRKYKNHKGFALVISLLLLLMMTVMGITMVARSNLNTNMSVEYDKSEHIFVAAEAGIEHARRYLENLSSLFHIFWNKGKENKSLRFIDESDLGKTISKIYWIKSMQIVYKSAFDILGIKLIKKM